MIHSVGSSINGTTVTDAGRTFQPSLEKADPLKGIPGSAQRAQTNEAAAFTEQDVEREIEKFNQVMQAADQSLRFKFHKEAETLIVELYDLKTDEVIKTMPPEYLLELTVKMKELIGLFIDKRL